MKRIAIIALVVLLLCGCAVPASSETNIAAPEPIHEENKETAVKDPDSLYEITYQKSRPIKISDDVYAEGIIEITNISSEFLKIEYGHIDVEDGSGKLLSADPTYNYGPDIFGPGEKAYIYLNEMVDEEAPSEINLLVSPDINKTTDKLTSLLVSDVEVKFDEYGFVSILGRIENNTGKEIESAKLWAVCFDRDGKPLFGNVDYLYGGIKDGQKQGFEMSCFCLPEDITEDKISSCTVYAYEELF